MEYEHERAGCRGWPGAGFQAAALAHKAARPLLAFTLLLCAGASEASTLTTPSFVVRIEVKCEEGNVTCDNVTYVGKSRKTGKSIALRGRTLHGRCADGSAACRFQGYEFRNGATRYLVLEDGRLIVRRKDKVLLEEKGSWAW